VREIPLSPKAATVFNFAWKEIRLFRRNYFDMG